MMLEPRCLIRLGDRQNRLRRLPSLGLWQTDQRRLQGWLFRELENRLLLVPRVHLEYSFGLLGVRQNYVFVDRKLITYLQNRSPRWKGICPPF
jgi:hypothetical protein